MFNDAKTVFAGDRVTEVGLKVQGSGRTTASAAAAEEVDVDESLARRRGIGRLGREEERRDHGSETHCCCSTVDSFDGGQGEKRVVVERERSRSMAGLYTLAGQC